MESSVDSTRKNSDPQEEIRNLREQNEALKKRQIEAERMIAEFRADLEPIRKELAQAKARLAKFESVLAPRLMSIITLRPLRFILSERNRAKKAGRSSASASKPDGGGSAAEHMPVKRVRRTSIYDSHVLRKPIGVAVFAHDRAGHLAAILESLALQDEIANTTVFIDGDQGRPAKRRTIDKVEETARSFGVAHIRRNRGNYGFRKMMIIAMREMMAEHERILFLEDDCFPTGAAIKGFSYELDSIEDDSSIFSVYGHPFLVEGEGENFARFQGWGWATTRTKLRPIWEKLRDCYLMSEPEYLQFVKDALTPEVRARIEITPGRQPTATLEHFFAWDETVCLLTAMEGLTHHRSTERIIYNFGAGHGSTHFGHVDWFRHPPFNMIGRDDVWDHF